MSVYNLIWADDEIDQLLDKETEDELSKEGFRIVGRAHDGIELEKLLDNNTNVDAVIVDANFKELGTNLNNERETSGLDWARHLYAQKLKRSIPFFLYTNRGDELLQEIYENRPEVLKDFPRHERWFKKSISDDYEKMFEKIKEAVDDKNSPYHVIRERYEYELNAASLLQNVEEFIFDFLVKDYTNSLDDIIEPFIQVRKTIEKIFCLCEKTCIIPPISNDTNGSAHYLLKNKYSPKNNDGKCVDMYKMLNEDIIPKPLARSLLYIVDITQDGAHHKGDLKLKVDEYFTERKDVLLLRSVVYILIDVIKWFAITYSNHRDKDINEHVLWEKCG